MRENGVFSALRILLLKVTYCHCLALLCYSKMAMFQAKNRAFRVIQHYEYHIYSESTHQKQSFKKIKMICHVSISKINFI